MNESLLSRRQFSALLGASATYAALPALADDDEKISPQPFFASAMRAITALADAGQPIALADADRLAALATQGDLEAVVAAEAILGRYTLVRVVLDGEGVGRATQGGADGVLVEQGWTVFLIRVSNPAGLTGVLDVAPGDVGPSRMSLSNNEQRAGLIYDSPNLAPVLEKMWITAQIQSNSLSGALIEYKMIELFSRDRGDRSGVLGFGVGSVEYLQSTLKRSSWSSWKHPLRLNFTARPTADVMLRVLDEDGTGCMASLTIRDARSHVYPPQVMRLAPDLSFQPHVYRADGETMRLPDGDYLVTSWRGPEYLKQEQRVEISDSNRRISIRLKRWIDPAKFGWYSGDTHLHAAGCAHYMHPTEGVAPETMIRHVRGEGLAIGEVLTWGPAWYHQKQFFNGHAVSPEAKLENLQLQIANNTSLRTNQTQRDRESMVRYDVEVSRFPSSMNGHLVLLRLKDQDFPGTRSIEDWPSWNLPILRWAKSQGAIGGYAHCSAGMIVESALLPNYEIPPFDSIGTNEAIVDVTHDACDFLSGCNGPPVAELNAWYHMLNCGFTLAMVGETDYPCFTPSIDARPGMGRSYVHLNQRPLDDAGYEAWVRALQDGKLYWGDGRAHFLRFTANGHMSGKRAHALRRAGNVEVLTTVAALLEEEPSKSTVTNAAEEPWHIEHARIGASRNVLLELIVNGVPSDKVEIRADGVPHNIRFQAKIERSSWVALRVMGSAHTYPVFVTVGGCPIRASRRSAEWLRRCVDALWSEKQPLIREREQDVAAQAYDHARRVYDRIIDESDVA